MIHKADFVPRATDSLLAILPAEAEEPAASILVTSITRFPTVVSAKTPLTRAAELLVRPGCGVLVVVDERRRPLGVVTAADALALARRLSPARFDFATALDAASSGGRFVPESSTLTAVHASLLDENRDFFVVVDRDGRLSGIITAMDVLEALAEAPPVSGVRHAAPIQRCG